MTPDIRRSLNGIRAHYKKHKHKKNGTIPLWAWRDLVECNDMVEKYKRRKENLKNGKANNSSESEWND